MTSTDDIENMLPSRKNLSVFKQTYLKQSRTPFTPDVISLEASDGMKFVLKDISTRPLWVRVLWARRSMRREVEAYRKLIAVPGVPELITQLDADGFVMEWVDAHPLPSRRERDIVGLEFFKRLEAVVQEMHARGVAHGDLRRQNILRTASGDPCIVDFETAVVGRRLFPAIANIDQLTVLKIRGRYFPESITETDRQKLQAAPWHLKAGRFLRKRIYGPLSPKGFRKRRKEKL